MCRLVDHEYFGDPNVHAAAFSAPEQINTCHAAVVENIWLKPDAAASQRPLQSLYMFVMKSGVGSRSGVTMSPLRTTRRGNRCCRIRLRPLLTGAHASCLTLRAMLAHGAGGSCRLPRERATSWQPRRGPKPGGRAWWPVPVRGARRDAEASQDDHAQYIDHWLKIMKDDKRMGRGGR